jgi:hypothetical protein
VTLFLRGSVKKEVVALSSPDFAGLGPGSKGSQGAWDFVAPEDNSPIVEASLDTVATPPREFEVDDLFDYQGFIKG